MSESAVPDLTRAVALLSARCLAAYQALGIAAVRDREVHPDDLNKIMSALWDESGLCAPEHPAFNEELARLLPVRVAPTPAAPSGPQTGEAP